MTLSIDQLQVTSFETAGKLAVASVAVTVPMLICYSPRCIPTALPAQCS